MAPVAQGRLCIFVAAVLWSLSGFFTQILTQPTVLGVHDPAIETWGRVPMQIPFYRAFFAGLVLVPTLRIGDLRFRPAMLAMLACFALMNVAFITAIALGGSANAIFLQNSAPFWIYLASIYWLGEKPDRASTLALFVGLAGIAVIVLGEGVDGDLSIVAIGLFSGMMYAGVILGLRLLREMSPAWLTVWNHLFGSLTLLPLVLALQPPTGPQLVTLFLFGAVQLGFPYWLMARGLRHVNASEAAAITLLEPILTPVWEYLTVGTVPRPWTLLGGAIILGALAYRYWPRRRDDADSVLHPAGTP